VTSIACRQSGSDQTLVRVMEITLFKKERERRLASQNDGARRPRALLCFGARLWRAGWAIVTKGRLSF